MEMCQRLDAYLKGEGAALVGYADLAQWMPYALPRAVVFAIALPKDVIRGIDKGPTPEYYQTYISVNTKLRALADGTVKLLEEQGFAARAQYGDNIEFTAPYTTMLPYKTAALRAGLGWIGRSDLFVTEQYGSAIRLMTVLTDAPLPCGTPVTKSRCGNCTRCVEACPAKAIKGTLWEDGIAREELYDPKKCSEMARALTLKNTHQNATICGKCIEVCPFTKRYLG